MRLADERCVPNGEKLTRLSADEARELSGQLSNDWSIDDDHLERILKFPDFAKALAFTNAVGAIAEQEGHHPDICLGWGKARVTISTHDVGGLSRADFVLAAKIDRVLS